MDSNLKEVTVSTFSRRELAKVLTYLCKEVIKKDKQQVLDEVFGKDVRRASTNSVKKQVTWSDMIVILDRHGLKPQVSFVHDPNRSYQLLLVRDSVSNQLMQVLADSLKKKEMRVLDEHPHKKNPFENY